MRVLFIGQTGLNIGPSNVNNELIKSWPDPQNIVIIDRLSPLNFVSVLKIVCSIDIVLADGFYFELWLFQRLCLLLDKKFYVLSHGYLPYENKVNQLGYSKSACRRYNCYLLACTAVIVLSEAQKKCILKFLPQMKNKLYVCKMGIVQAEREHYTIKDGTTRIALSGGTRPIKRNRFVIDAIKCLEKKYLPVNVYIYGDSLPRDRSWLTQKLDGINLYFRGQIPQVDFQQELQEMDIFIMASEYESFGLSAVDAVQSGCSLLISESCGALEVFELNEKDMIKNTDSDEDLALKIQSSIDNPNACRLKESINYTAHNWKSSSKALFEYFLNG